MRDVRRGPSGCRFGQARAQAIHDHAAELHQLLVRSGIALAIMPVASIVLGWLIAGRVLRPLRAITATTRQISERNLHERLAFDGPRDELKDLADTVDGLLARLETAFGPQRRFVANAARELRTPLTLLHAQLEETLSDPSATIDSFRTMSTRLLADTILLQPRPEVADLSLRIDANIRPAPTIGDAGLAERLVSNLIDNAVRHNVADGEVQIKTGTRDGRAFVAVSNAGPVIPAAEVERLFEPFQRLGADRTARTDGHHGLGLSIVRAIATARHATVTATARPRGGLAVEVDFPLDGDRRQDARADPTRLAVIRA